ncbi:hypothetical protein BB559_004562 [Furculomyces boomerangus]|uniref:Transmembrane protein 198 n=1 Tax=Furculomyces boomerangus TaxID=61424 RepID=A0A2T9YE38_9FUNG|nr:hypothetical protein BB559_004562 [Furculomyces boomerangus]
MLVQYILLLLFSANVFGKEILLANNSAILVTKIGGLNAQGIFAGIVLIILGFTFTFCGRKLVKVLVFISGFAFTVIFVLVIAYRIRAPQPGENARALIYLIIAIITGFLGGGFAVWSYKFGLFVVGALGGFAVSSYIIAWSGKSLFADNWIRFVFILVFCIIGGFLVVFFERPAMIFCTSIYGSYALFVGIDCFARVGFKELVFSILHNVQAPTKTSPAVYGFLAGTILVSAIGMLFQFKTTKA